MEPILFEGSVTAVRYQNVLEELLNQLYPDELHNGYFRMKQQFVQFG
jgi:hypothetical protein